MLEYTYNEITGRLWSDHFEGFCTGLRDLCDLDLDVKRSNVSMATYFQEYTIDGKLHGVERDDMPKFLNRHGVANDETRSRANPSNWILFLTEREGLAEKYEELHKASNTKKAVEEVIEIVDQVFEEITEGESSEETEEEQSDVEGQEEEASSETDQEQSEDDVTVSEDEVDDTPSVPDMDYVKSLKDLEDGQDKLKEYGTQFGIEVTGKNWKGCYMSFCNKWKKIEKDLAKA